MTSFTPQGGGETPKALSSRVLVAAYWLFVVLMLATFTANLAAFLTVERMQDTVKSLEELNRQSKINYTVMSDSPYLEYFQVRTVTIVTHQIRSRPCFDNSQNMANAEEDLYGKWKEMTLNSGGEETR